ncbi:hypothetical protein BDA96_04G197600 [Sorghum bicolor]|uniref:Uncharacterized protein n=1 Tax=Sorghum bicolor TaxID=4558 RepID=A0A921R5J5_SORBI|nr:hypothetical protein BDA96_04G197600 [Sorghum bicolor]
MEQDTPMLKPGWMQHDKAAGTANIWATASSHSDYQATGGSLRNHSSGHYRDHGSQQSSSGRSSGSNGSRRSDRDGMGKSRDYINFRKFKDRDRQRDFDSRDWESRPAAAVRDDFKSFSTCKSERDRMNRTRLKADTWNKGSGSTSRNNAVSSSRSNDIHISSTVASTGTVNSVRNAALGTSISNASVRTSVSTTSISNAVSNASNAASITFEREFPQLSSEDKNGRQGISKVPSASISTAIQNVPLISPDGWSSMLADLPLLSDPKKSLATSSLLHIAPSKQTEVVPNSGTALSMAETVMQAPPRISIRPQLSTEAQKIEERTLKQLTLRPITPPASKSSALSSLKIKGTRLGDPTNPIKTSQLLKIQSANGSARAPVKADVSKLSQPGSFQILSREQNGTAHTTKDCPVKPVSPPTPLVSVETQKKPVVSQKLKFGTDERPLPLQGPSRDRKSNARDKVRFFEMLRTKSSNGSSTAFESGSQPSPSSLVDVKQDSSLNIANDFSLFPSEMKCTGHGKCVCEEANSSEGSQRHLSDTEEHIPSLKSVVGGMPQQPLVESREADSSSEPADTGDEGFQSSLSGSTEGSLSSTPADSDAGNEEASSLSEDTEPDDVYHPADISPEDKHFMMLLGWKEDEIVQVAPLDFDEIADTVKGCEELKKKLQSMEYKEDIKSILLHIELSEKLQQHKSTGA